MDAGHLPAVLAWGGLALGYGWTVHRLGRMSRASRTRAEEKLTLPVEPGALFEPHDARRPEPTRDSFEPRRSAS